MELFLRIIGTAWQGFKRNGWLSLVAIFMMMQSLLLISIFLSLNVAVDQTIKAVNERIDVAIFFKEYVPESDILVFRDQIQSLDGVKDITFVSQAEALASYIERNQGNQELLDVVGDDASFLPASLEIKVTDPYLIEPVVAQVTTADTNQLILETSLQKNQEVIDRLRRVNGFIAMANIILSLIFVVIALLIIFNTIRMTIFTRKEEIEIMKLVGATDWYIRWPFLLEGVFYGVAGAVLAFIATVAGYWILISSIGSDFFAFGATGTGTPIFGPIFALQLLLVQVTFGIVVGIVSSYLSTKRHLRT